MLHIHRFRATPTDRRNCKTPGQRTPVDTDRFQQNQLRGSFNTHAATGPYNAHYDRPALLQLLGHVEGLSVLDAGCGPGLYAQELTARGARVLGVDASPEMIRLASKRNGGGAEFRVHDLESPLDWAENKSFDRIVMALVLHHLQNPRSVLREFHHVLRDDGRLLLSTVHPVADWRRLGGSYFADERVQETWSLGLEAEFRRAPLTAVIADFTAAGFAIEALVEPQPAPSMEAEYPKHAERLSAEPGFIAFSLIKHPSSQG
nr:class I SAM-dependent methyltransferase [Nesterenkonia alkaliphila]